MSARDELLVALIATLRRIEQLLPSTKAAWYANETARLAIERLWIEAGNLAEEYRRQADLPVSADPWGELYSYRNRLAHALPGDISPERVWDDTTADLARLFAEVRSHRPST